MKIIVDNHAVEYEGAGTGPVILLLHGWMQSLHTFDALVPALSISFRVIRLDLPGFGGSEPPKSAWGVGEYARFVRDFCEKLQIQPEIVLGHSFSGRIAAKGTAEGVLRPKKLILIASAGLAKHKTVRSRLFWIVAKAGKMGLFLFPRSVQDRFRRRLYEKAGSEYLDAGPLKDTFLLVTREDLSEAARKIHVPTLLIWGENDTETPLSDGRRLKELISGARLKILNGAGHFVHQEKPVEVARLISEFLLNKGGVRVSEDGGFKSLLDKN